MALVFDNTADGLILRFQNNDINNDTWTIDEESWASLQGWTPSQGREVADAAHQNTSIKILQVYAVDQMTDETIDVLSFILGRLHRLTLVRIIQEDGAAPVPMNTLDKLYTAIAKCPSDVERLDCRACITARGFHALVDSFPSLETLDVHGPRHSPQECQTCAMVDDFAFAFAAAAARSLPSLQNILIYATEPNPVLSTLLTALHTSSSVATVDVDAPCGDVDLVRAARSFCACTKSVEKFVVRGKPPSQEEGQEMDSRMTDMTAFFDIGPIPSFSPTITRLELYSCDFRHPDTEKIVKNAAKALQNVLFLRFGSCHFPSAMKVVKRLPRLTKLSFVSRDYVGKPYEAMDARGYDSRPETLLTNQDLAVLCRAVERQGSMLDDIELDLVCANGESFSDVARLMGACKGRLVLNFGEFSWRWVASLVEGAHRLRHDFIDLRLRFLNCELEDPNYADIFQPLLSNKALTYLELGFDPNRELECTELSSAAILGLIDSNTTLRTLSLRGLRLNGATEILEGIMPVLATKNRSLRTLELHGRGLDDCLPRARALALDALKDNDVLSDLVGFAIPKGDPLDNLLRQNRYGRIFLRANDPTPIGIWATVLARVSHDQQIGVMYKFLRAKPCLVRLTPATSVRPLVGA